MRSIAVANQKGGVGKTTTSVNLAVGLSRAGQRVCLVDLDPQSHTTLHLGIAPGSHPVSGYDVLVFDAPLAEACVDVSENLSVIVSHIDLSAVDVTLAGRNGRERILREKIEADSRCAGTSETDRPFDYMVIDCPPSLGLLSLNAMAAVDEVLLPLQPHFLALHGLSKLLETIELISEQINPRLSLLGVVLCMFESGTRLATEVGRDVQSFFEAGESRHSSWSEARLFESRIRRNIRLAEAPSFGQSIFEYAPDSHGATDYESLAKEVLSSAVVSQKHLRHVA